MQQIVKGVSGKCEHWFDSEHPETVTCSMNHFVWDHSCITFAKYSEKVTSPTAWYAHVRVGNKPGGKKYFCQEFLGTEW